MALVDEPARIASPASSAPPIVMSLPAASFIWRTASTYLEPADGDPLEIHLIQRDLALHMGRSAELNRQQLRILMMVFRLGALLLMAEVLAWVVALVVRG
jgi:hypothetical protein